MQVFISFQCSRGFPPAKPGSLCTLGSSTPLDVPLTGVARRSPLLFCVCLGHRVMSNHVGSQVGALSYPVSPRRGDSTLIRARNLRLYVRAHACEGGHMQAPIYTNL